MEIEEVDGQGVLLALTRRWRWLAAGAVIGVLLAVLLTLVLPKRYTATGDLLLQSTQGASNEQASRMETSAQLAHSIPVAERAIGKLGGTGDPEALLEEYRASRLTNELLRLEAWASSPELAARRVSAIAAAYLDYLADEQDQELASIQATVEARTAQLQTRIAELDVQISTSGGAAEQPTPEQSLLLTSLVAQREELSNERADVQATLDEAQAQHRRALDGNKMLADPLLPKSPSNPRPREFVAIGFLVGAMLAAGVIIVRDVLSRRLFRREQLARAAGVSVVASPKLHVRKGPTGRAQLRRLARQVASPSRELTTATGALVSLLRSRGEPEPPPLVVVSMAAEAEALAITLRLAMDLASQPWTASHRLDGSGRRAQRSPGPTPQTRRWRDIVVIDCTAGEHPVVGPLVRAVLTAGGRPDEAALESARSFRVSRTAEGAVVWQPIHTVTAPLEAFDATIHDHDSGIRPDTVEKLDLLIAFAGDWRSAAASAHQLPVLDSGASLIMARAGRVTAANVEESASALRRAGTAPVGIVVVHPDRFDTSTGQLPAPAGGAARLHADIRTSEQETERRSLRRL